jgi:hypothetical protein
VNLSLHFKETDSTMFTDAAYWNAVAAIAASFTVVAALVSAHFAREALFAQSQPKVIVYVKHDTDRPTMLCIVIENIGRDVAECVTFKLSRPIPAEAFGLLGRPISPAKNMDAGPLVNGILALGPGAPRVLTWGQMGGLSLALKDNPIEVAISYMHGKRMLKGTSILEVESFMHTDASEKPILAVAQNTLKIADSLKAINSTLAELKPSAPAGTSGHD